MKVVIRNKNEGPRFLCLYLPLFVMKWKVVAKALADQNGWSVSSPAELHQIMKDSYKEIRRRVRKYGHFDLVRVDTHDGTHIRIRV